MISITNRAGCHPVESRSRLTVSQRRTVHQPWWEYLCDHNDDDDNYDNYDDDDDDDDDENDNDDDDDDDDDGDDDGDDDDDNDNDDDITQYRYKLLTNKTTISGTLSLDEKEN